MFGTHASGSTRRTPLDTGVPPTGRRATDEWHRDARPLGRRG